MDYLSSAVSGAVFFDFANPNATAAEKLQVDLPTYGYVLFMVSTGTDRTDLTEEYAAILREICMVVALCAFVPVS